MTDYESVLCVKNEVFVYKIPARTSNRGYRAADWKLDEPDWKGRLRIASKGTDLYIKLEDKNTGELFAKCPVDGYPGVAVEQVLDSSRYFVLRLQDDGGRAAFIGLGFADRGDSFDLIVAIQDHFKWMKREAAEEDASAASLASNQPAAPKVDLGFKQGQTIKLNLSTKKKDDRDDDDEPSAAASKSRPMPRMQVTSTGILPPPPGSAGRIAPPPSGRAATQAPAQRPEASPQHHFPASPAHQQQYPPSAQPLGTAAPQGRPQQGNIVDLLGDLDLSAGSASSKAVSSGPHTVDLLGGYLDTSANQPAQAPQASAGWTSFN